MYIAIGEVMIFLWLAIGEKRTVKSVFFLIQQNDLIAIQLP